MIKFITNKLLKKIGKKRKCKFSYSQSGEDLIINFIFKVLKVKNPGYLDIGAHHPFYLSNTAFFYERGSTGVCVEPDPELFQAIRKSRPKDTCLNIGIDISSQKKADFYVMSFRALNTFSKEEAERCESYGNQTIEKIIEIPLLSVNELIETHFQGKAPDFVSLDVEGLDFKIIQSIDFRNFRPAVFCVETLTYSEDASERKITGILDFMLENNYMIYADTYINTIFVDRERWDNRLRNL